MSSHEDFLHEDVAHLPAQPIWRLLAPISRFLRVETISGVILLLVASLAIAAANSPWAEAFKSFWALPAGVHIGAWTFELPLTRVVTDGLMTLFFFVIGLEVKRELVIGELRRPQVALIPAAAALGGMLVPPLLYLALLHGRPGAQDWGVVMVTDTAFVVGALAIFAKRVPHSLRAFVLSVAVIDDVVAVAVIATAYSSGIKLHYLALGALMLAAIIGLRYVGVRLIPIYFIMGALSWYAFDLAGVHPTLVGILLGLFTPARPWVGADRFKSMMQRITQYLTVGDRQDMNFIHSEPATLMRSMAFAARELLSPLERLEFTLHPWVSFVIVPVFALATAGVPLRIGGFDNAMVIAIIVGSTIGKPVGILSGSFLATRLAGIALPPHLTWPLLAAAGCLCGISFTMGLFVANLAFADRLLGASTLGILAASFCSALVGLTLLLIALRLRRDRAVA